MGYPDATNAGGDSGVGTKAPNKLVLLIKYHSLAGLGCVDAIRQCDPLETHLVFLMEQMCLMEG